jgi:colicin import membrane protein
MSATALRRPRGPELARNSLPSFAAALAMHALLIAAMWFAVQWRTTSESPAVAELWAPLAPVEPPAAPPEPPAPPQPQEAKPDADIVEQQRVKPHAPEVPSPPPQERHVNEKPQPKKAEPKKAEPKKEPSPEQIERQEREAEQRRQTEIARLTGQVTGTEHSPAASQGVMSDSYKGLIIACVRPHIAYAVPDGTSEQIYAAFKVELLPTGEQAAPPQLIKPSGLPGYDDAAERAIIRCDPFPRDKDGTVPRSFTLRMYPTVTR